MIMTVERNIIAIHFVLDLEKKKTHVDVQDIQYDSTTGILKVCVLWNKLK